MNIKLGDVARGSDCLEAAQCVCFCEVIGRDSQRPRYMRAISSAGDPYRWRLPFGSSAGNQSSFGEFIDTALAQDSSCDPPRSRAPMLF
jgi:hypothetical protein